MHRIKQGYFVACHSKQGYSLSVGGTHCMSCHRYYRLFAFLLCLGIVKFCIALVFLTLTLNLTVAVGTIKFYAMWYLQIVVFPPIYRA